jgi:hypothetical protein
VGFGGGSSNCSASTGEVGRCSGFVHLGYGVASSKTKIGIPSSVAVENTVGETLTRALMQSVVQFADMLEYSLGDALDARPFVILRPLSK